MIKTDQGKILVCQSCKGELIYHVIEDERQSFGDIYCVNCGNIGMDENYMPSGFVISIKK